MSASRRRRKAAPPPAAPLGGPRRRAGGRGLYLGALALLATVALGAWFLADRGAAGPSNLAVGAGDACRTFPRFTANLGLGPGANIGTSVQGVTGLAILDPDRPAEEGGLVQHETWDDAGHLGPYAYDGQGNMYVAPVPHTSLQVNPPELQNRIYRVDTDSMVMGLLADLPPAQAPSGANPFGVIGLAYDCDVDRLYAASVAGSTAGQELGRLFAVDPATGQVADQLADLDPFGLAAFNGAQGKRLYYGLARRPELWSVALDAAGGFAGEPRRELSLAELPGAGSDKIRRVRFSAGPVMTLHAYDFNFSLQVASERREVIYAFGYDPATDRWEFQGQQPGSSG